MAQHVRFGSDGAGGVLLKPAAAPLTPNPAVVLLPAIAGVNDYVKRVGMRLVEQGYGVVAIDYFSRAGSPPDLSSPDKTMAAVAALPDEQVVDDVGLAIDYLSEEELIDSSRVAVLGFCVGGSLAILSALRLHGLACAIAFYGVLRYGALTQTKPVSPLDAVEQLDVPFLGHWGDADHLVPDTDVAELRQRLRGKPAEILSYPGAGHAFHEDFRDVYRPVAAAEAWHRSLRFLGWYLRSEPSG